MTTMAINCSSTAVGSLTVSYSATPAPNPSDTYKITIYMFTTTLTKWTTSTNVTYTEADGILPGYPALVYVVAYNGGSGGIMVSSGNYGTLGCPIMGTTGFIEMSALDPYPDSSDTTIQLSILRKTSLLSPAWCTCRNTKAHLYVNGSLRETKNIVSGLTNAPYISFSLFGLASGTTYNMAVYAESPEGLYATPVTGSYTTTGTPPAPVVPTNLSSTSVGTGGFTLNWTTNAYNSGYKIYTSIDNVSFSFLGSYATSGYPVSQPSYTTRYYRVSGVNSVGVESAQSSSLSVTTLAVAPVVPTNLSHSGLNSSGFTLNWTTDSANASYKIYRSSNGVSFSLLVGSVSNSGYAVSQVANATFYYKVSGVNAASTESAQSGALSVTTPAAAPVTPTNLSATGVTSNGFTLNWTTNTANAYYKVYSSSDGISFNLLDGNVSNSGYPVSQTTNTTLYYKVSGVNAVGTESSQSSALSVTTAAPIPSAPTELGANNITASSFTLIWTAPAYATSYDVYRDGTPIATNHGSTSLSISGLAANTSYSMTVVAKNGSGSSPASSPVVVVTATPVPSAPTGLGASSITTSSFTLSWTAPAYATSYDVFRDGTAIATNHGSTSLSVSGLSANTAYSMTVVAKNGSGSSAPSAAFVVTTTAIPPSVPTILDPTNLSTAGFNLNWTTSTANTSYKIYFSNDNITYSLLTTTANSGYYVNQSAGTTVYYKVSGINAIGTESARSLAREITTISGAQLSYMTGQMMGNVFVHQTLLAVDISTSASGLGSFMQGTTIGDIPVHQGIVTNDARPIGNIAGLMVGNALAGFIAHVTIQGGQEDQTITIAAIPGITNPITGAAPVTAVDSAQYTGTVSWSPSASTFAAETVYTATVTLTAKAGYTLTGVPANFFTINGSAATNAANSGVVTKAFSATAPVAGWSAAGGLGNSVASLLVVNNELYAGGSFTNKIAKWNGSGWPALGTGMDNSVYALTVLNNELYAGGSFTTAGGVSANSIAKWNGSSWSALGTGLNSYGHVYALTVFNNELYVGGNFIVAGGVSANSIAKWNGSSWSALGTGMSMSSSVLALTVFNNELYAGGSFTTAGGVTANRVAKWNGSSWSALGTGMNSSVYALTVLNNELYAGGSFTTADGVTANRVAKWNGSSWSALGTGMDGGVLALTVFNNELHAGGQFTTAGGVTANRVAKWNGSSWSALGTGITNSSNGVKALAVFNNELYVGGEFTTAGGVSANSIARWTPAA